MITAKEILKLLDAGGPEAFEYMGFFYESRKGLDLPASALLKDIGALIQAQKNLAATVAYAKQLTEK